MEDAPCHAGRLVRSARVGENKAKRTSILEYH